ncbi:MULTISPECIES: McrB family protein [unclassified Francisella]|uniref:McrB family protein n=1 Tax=unclassified Francisella TaxID=2610885 RepID=UPI002E2F66C7|nr:MULTISPECIES: AAA family ATPase [unclassified Francisella]MED7819521.1 AAA family ATPase [Francisella sp. 19S2-4]MED7830310.1 AAA family ATPase [Francisella sp. 19S2-10]
MKSYIEILSEINNKLKSKNLSNFCHQKYQNASYLWVGDGSEKIGIRELHYEVRYIEKDNIFQIEIHSESKNNEKSKDLQKKIKDGLFGYYQLNDSLKNSYELKNTSKKGLNNWLIVSKKRYNLNDEKIVEDILDGLEKLDNDFGNKCRDIMRGVESLEQTININMINKEMIEKSKQLLNNKKQIILYGPAGTGKTFNTKSIIVNHAFGDADNIDEKYEELQDQGRVKFVTFHQSFAYEDFIEGIKPIPEDRDVKYDVQDGIFKELCGSAQQIDFHEEQVLKATRAEYKVVKVTSETLCLEDKNAKKFMLFRECINRFVEYINRNRVDLNSFKADQDTAESYFGKNSNAFQINQHTGAYTAAIKYIFEEENKNNQSYYLIIDEINRGNISKIFGELITLLESNKRLGNKETELKTKLPYSKEDFGIPPNLYIIGTMNTSDKSIAHLDIALRRRFGFVEMLPDPEILENSECKSLLQKLNQRIEILLDKDHLIGHSFFCGKSEADIPTIMQNEIIPLLEEYFYGDYEKIQLVLGSKNLNSEKFEKHEKYKDITNIKKLLENSNKETKYDYWFQLGKDFDSSLGEKAEAEGE